MGVIHVFVILTIAFHCNGFNIYEALATRKKLQNAITTIKSNKIKNHKLSRRFSIPNEPSVILGAPTWPYHLPKAEPILPGHTLIRPSIGMLKSSMKFPHRELEDGSGVNGNYENLGIKYDGKNERVLYTGFRRSQPQLQKFNARRSSYNPYLYRRRHLEIYPHNSYNKKQRLSQTLSPVLPQRPRNYYYQIYLNIPKRVRFREPEDNILSPEIFVKIATETDLLNVFRIINSLRRDQDEKKEEEKLLYAPGTANYGDFGIAESDSESGPVY